MSRCEPPACPRLGLCCQSHAQLSSCSSAFDLSTRHRLHLTNGLQLPKGWKSCAAPATGTWASCCWLHPAGGGVPCTAAVESPSHLWGHSVLGRLAISPQWEAEGGKRLIRDCERALVGRIVQEDLDALGLRAGLYAHYCRLEPHGHCVKQVELRAAWTKHV